MRDDLTRAGVAGSEREEVRRHVAEVLASAQFGSAPRLSGFLSFIVEAVLEGKSSEVKESLIAVEVYGRTPGYDPRTDSTVRVEAWRLRAKLREYYAARGEDSAIVIELPKGGYVPVFRRTAADSRPKDQPKPVRTRHLAAAAAAVALMVAGGGTPMPRPVEQPEPETSALYSRAWELLRHYRTEDGKILAAEESVRRSLPLFQEVVRRSPTFARGWASLAEANEFAYELDRGHSRHLLDAARNAARRAVALDGGLPEAHTVLCSILFFRDWELPEAEDSCRRAVDLNPRDVVAQRRLADLRRVQGKWRDAARELERAIGLMPADPGLRLRRARLYYDAQDYERASREVSSSLALNTAKQLPSWTLAMWLRGLCQEQLGNPAEAEAAYRAALAHDADDMWNQSALAYLLAKAGRAAEAESLLGEMRQGVARGEDRHFALALANIGLGRNSEALEWLERGAARREDAMLFIGLEQRFHPLRGQPRFQALLALTGSRAAAAPAIGIL